MTPLRLELRRSEPRVDPPLANAGKRWDRRSVGALLLHEAGASGPVGWGEASPLPGYSPDTDADVERAVASLGAERLVALAALSTAEEVFSAVAALQPAWPPAARFGLETLLLDRLARASGRPLWQLLAQLAGTGSAPREVALCALLSSAEPAAAAEPAERYVRAGVRTFKLKIGPERLRPEQEATLEALRGRWGNDVALRLDANGSLARAELGPTLERLARFDPELLEEPIASPAPEELAQSPCPIALDESLQGLTHAQSERLLERSGAHVIVLKPTALGGLGACLRLAAAARRLGREVVVSHALEGPVGWAACAHLALALASPRAAGLWPLAHQRAALPEVARGRLLAPAGPGLGALP
jgi:o-succinylbenzoate synthase